MFGTLARKFFGSKNERELKRIQPLVTRINELEREVSAYTDEMFAQKSMRFREELAGGRPIIDILPEAFALAREGARRSLGMRHFDVQLIGGIFLHEGKIAEMKTGEGKTLVATLPVYLNALTGKGVHVVTVNDYLAKRDSEWMSRFYRFMGLSTGVIVHGLNDRERRAAYHSDITYGTNNEFGFDYLRDNMKYQLENYVQRPLHYAIVDEVDSILIDEARTPLIISGPTDESTDKYVRVNAIMPALKKETDYTVDEKARAVMLTEDGVSHVETLLGLDNLYAPEHISILHHVNQALKAHVIFKCDVDYVVKDGKVTIVDEFTGRLMPGRRYSDGLHQALEAKERVQIENENQTLATVTFQNYFRMYEKLAGMTGTADTEAVEFHKIYKLDVVVIPTHRTMSRIDRADIIYKSERAKFNAVATMIKEFHDRKQPVLVGTVSVEKSERLSALLKQNGVPHHVLNAKYHEREAEIISQAGRLGAVTISTNMAGRGTDILLGGNPEVMAKHAIRDEMSEEEKTALIEKFKTLCAKEHEEVVKLGGLVVLGTERHESRRIDNQLRGRAGRQGDPGMSQFTISLEDDLMRIFGSERIATMMDRLGMQEDETIEHPWISKAIENAQRRVEGHNFDIRKNVIEFDDVMNKQRQTVYGKRRAIIEGKDTKDILLDHIDMAAETIGNDYAPQKGADFDPKPLEERLLQLFNWTGELPDTLSHMNADMLGEWVYETARAHYERREAEIGTVILRQVERVFMLQTLDQLWKDHLLNMDHVREGIGLRGYAQRDPIVEYKREGFALFQEMMTTFAMETVQKLFHVKMVERPSFPDEDAEDAEDGDDDSNKISSSTSPEVKEVVAPKIAIEPVFKERSLSYGRSISQAPVRPSPVKSAAAKVGRNDPCVCGSGKKYKKCCGAQESGE